MQRIVNPPNNLFEDGDPSQGVVGTVVTADWLNCQQEEATYVVEQEGITLDPNDNTQLYQALSRRLPTGFPGIWLGETPPPGWLECDGSAISRTTYANLFAVIGCRFGKGDGDTTFNLPDHRGKFARYWDHGAGIDPDAASRTSPFVSFTQTGDTTNESAVISNLSETDDLVEGMTVTGSGIPASTEILSIDSSSQVTLTQNATATGSGVTLTFELTGDHVGTDQTDEIKSHVHTGRNDAVSFGGEGAGNRTGAGDTGATGGNETRPVNVAVMPIIKY